MGYKLNIFTGQFDLTGASTGGSQSYKDPVATQADLPVIGNADADVRVVKDEDVLYIWDGTDSRWVKQDLEEANVGTTPNSQGYDIIIDDSTSNIRYHRLELEPADATNPGIISTSSQTIPGSKTFPNQIQTDGGIDLSTPGTLNIGSSSNSTVINIGNSGATINVQGDTFYQNVTNLNVQDKLITVNHGGSTGSGGGAGIEVEENATPTGYVKTSTDRNSWQLKAPNTAGIATITPGTSGITLDQSSHNPVTLAAFGSTPNANGLTLSTQVLNMQPADATNPGGISTTTQTFSGDKTFTGTITASNFTGSSSGSNTGDVTLAAVGSSPNANAASLAGQVLTLQPADGSNPGLITAVSQTLGGNKSFSGTITSNSVVLGSASNQISGLSTIINSGTLTLPTITDTLVGRATTDTLTNKTINGSNNTITNVSLTTGITGVLPIANGGTNLSTVPTNGQLLIGNTTGYTLAAITPGSGISVTNGTGSITIASTVPPTSGDLAEISFTALDGQFSPANITGAAFANGSVRSFKAIISIVRASTYAVYDLMGIQKASSWEMSQDYTGDVTGITFNINSSGQLQYVSDVSGATGLLKIRAIVTSV